MQEFAEFARSRDLSLGRAQGFELPYGIEADKACSAAALHPKAQSVLRCSATAPGGPPAALVLEPQTSRRFLWVDIKLVEDAEFCRDVGPYMKSQPSLCMRRA